MKIVLLLFCILTSLPHSYAATGYSDDCDSSTGEEGSEDSNLDTGKDYALEEDLTDYDKKCASPTQADYGCLLGEKAPYVCKICDTSFSKHVHAKRHANLHFSHYPDECLLCTFKGANPGTLLSHYQYNHTLLPEKCVACKEEIKSLKELIGHCKSFNGCKREFIANRTPSKTKKIASQTLKITLDEFRKNPADYFKGQSRGAGGGSGAAAAHAGGGSGWQKDRVAEKETQATAAAVAILLQMHAAKQDSAPAGEGCGQAKKRSRTPEEEEEPRSPQPGDPDYQRPLCQDCYQQGCDDDEEDGEDPVTGITARLFRAVPDDDAHRCVLCQGRSLKDARKGAV